MSDSKWVTYIWQKNCRRRCQNIIRVIICFFHVFYVVFFIFVETNRSVTVFEERYLFEIDITIKISVSPSKLLYPQFRFLFLVVNVIFIKYTSKTFGTPCILYSLLFLYPPSSFNCFFCMRSMSNQNSYIQYH